MGKVINLTDKLSEQRPIIKIGEKEYEVNDSLRTVFKVEELMDTNSIENTIKAVEIALGKNAVKELNIMEMSSSNFKTLMIAIMAAMQGADFDEAASRFQNDF